MAIPKELVQLRLYLMPRVAYCIVYRVNASANGEVLDVQYYQGFSTRHISREELVEIAATVRTRVCEQSKLGRDAIEEIRSPVRQGPSLRALIVVAGPTRAAGYAVIAKILAKDDDEMAVYGLGIQKIMQGKDAHEVPRPGRW